MRSFLLVAAFLVSMLSGCATYEIHSTAIAKNQPLPATHGVVALQVINNAERLAPLHKGWTAVIVVRTDNMDAIKAAAIAGLMRSFSTLHSVRASLEHRSARCARV